ncbi:MAG: hypothetical protein ACXVY3_02960, partial [Gaiellaceae bacterium]
MDHVITWGGDSEDVLVTNSGVASVEGFDAWVQDVLGDPRWRPPMRVLIDDRLVEWGEITAANMAKRGEMLTRDADRIGHSYVAIVVNRNLDFGLMMMERAYVAGRVQCELRIVRSMEEARWWLQQTTGEDPPPVSGA